MDVKKTIIQEFDKFVKDTFKKDEIKSFLLNHERKHILIDNLTKQINDSAHVILSNSRPTQENRATLKNIIKDFAHNFCKTALDVKTAELEKSNLTIGGAHEKRKKEEDGETDEIYT